MMRNSVFLDASFWIAYRDPIRQPHFSQAQKILQQLFQQRTRFVSTLPVVCEIYAYFSRDTSGKLQVLNDFYDNPLLQLIPVTGADEAEAIQIVSKHADKDYSLCDALTFAIMERVQISRAASFDRHFRQFGRFEVLE
jgi:uncharacterized protein